MLPDGRASMKRRAFKCDLCDDTGYKDHGGLSMDVCDHDEQPDPLEQVIIDAMAGKHLVIAGEIAKAIRASGVALSEGEHPNAADYRNRAERAEAECKEMRRALDPFARAYRIQPPGHEDWPDHRPNNEFLPTAWPDWGDFRRANAACPAGIEEEEDE